MTLHALRNTKLKIVASQSPESLIALRATEVRSAWLTLIAVPHMPQSWFAWFSAMDRLEAERLRVIHERKR